MQWLKSKQTLIQFLGEILQPVRMGNGIKKIYWSIQVREFMKKLHGILDFSLPSGLLPSQWKDKGRKKQKDDLLPVGWSMSQDSRGEIHLKECCFYFEAGEPQGETVQRCGCRGWVWNSPQLCSQRQTEHPLLFFFFFFLSYGNNYFP